MAHPPPEAHSLPSPPTDGISCLSYIRTTDLLASASWDGALRIHDTDAMSLVAMHNMDCGPLLSMAASSGESASSSGGGSIFTGGVDGSVRKFDITSSQTSMLGMHSPDANPLNPDKPVACSCLSHISSVPGGGGGSADHLVASAGWDSWFHVWDTRVSGKAVVSIELPGKAFSMDATGVNHDNDHRVVIATSGRKNCIVDVRTPLVLEAAPPPTKDDEKENELAKMILTRESSLKYPTRVVRFFPDGSGLALGSIEGRVAIEYLDDIGVSSGKKKYAFKCHRVNDTIYPVNSIAFHPIHHTFATGGCDGTVVTWDGGNKKKLSTIGKLPTSVASLAFNYNGTQIAMASSYTFEEGERDHPHDEIYVREILESEVRPKSSSSK